MESPIRILVVFGLAGMGVYTTVREIKTMRSPAFEGPKLLIFSYIFVYWLTLVLVSNIIL